MSEIEVKIRDDKAMLYTPYNPEFVKRIKKFSDARWNSGEKCWTITRAAEPARKDRAKRRGTPA